jgi:hypothetical protein
MYLVKNILKHQSSRSFSDSIMSVFLPEAFAKPTTKILNNAFDVCHKHLVKNPKQVVAPFLNQLKN